MLILYLLGIWCIIILITIIAKKLMADQYYGVGRNIGKNYFENMDKEGKEK